MAQQQETSMFGDDINSTPIAKLQIPVMTSKADSGAPPLEPPVYNPTVEQQPKRVRFEDPPVKPLHQQPKPEPPRYQRPMYMYPPPPPPPAPAQQPEKKKFVKLLGAYSHHLVVFGLIVGLLWYYGKFASFQYMGNGAGHLSVLGIVALAGSSAGIYGLAKHLLD